MTTATKEEIEARIHELDEILCNREACEMTEGWLSYGPDTADLAELYAEREQLLQQLERVS
jgi:hypothetical protein